MAASSKLRQKPEDYPEVLVSIAVGFNHYLPKNLAIENQEEVLSGGFKVRGARGKTLKRASLMTSSYSANRDKHF